MSPPNSRKRAAPGASPTPQQQQMTQTYPSASTQMSNTDFRWPQGSNNTDNMVFPDTYNLPTYSNAPQQQYGNQQQASSSTQLARRPMNQHLMQTQRYDDPNAWGQYGDEQLDVVAAGNGGVAENDNIELLEERAAVAKRESQSKRKQIPPFVQKLSRYVLPS
jgi:heat shock transcription factor